MITLLFLCTETATTTPPAPPPPIQRVSLGHSQVTLLYCNHHHSQLKYSHKAYQQRDAFVHCAVYLCATLRSLRQSVGTIRRYCIVGLPQHQVYLKSGRVLQL